MASDDALDIAAGMAASRAALRRQATQSSIAPQTLETSLAQISAEVAKAIPRLTANPKKLSPSRT